jgi:uncharacterized SAM-binding protein YcdF (DUF218 family)
VIATLRRPQEGGSKARRSRRPVLRWVWRGALLAAALVAAYLVLTFVQVWLASNRDSTPASDAIVVLGAAQYDCRPSPALEGRLAHALDLYETGVAGRIVVTGGKQAGDRCTEATAGAEWLMAEGVPDADILRENQGGSSWESLAAAARILRDQDMTRVVLVTDGYHALRVEAIAEQLGLEASVSPSHRGGSLPDLLKETAAVAVGRVVGFDRLVDIDGQVEDRIDETISTDQPTEAGDASEPSPPTTADVRSGDPGG